MVAERHKFSVKHGGWKIYRAEYQCWQDMKQRCLNKNNKSYANYGARGITVCEKWVNDFQSFFADMGPRPVGHSLDRIDNEKGYEPQNCRWATKTIQSRNTRRTAAEDVGVFVEKSSGKWVCYIAVRRRSVRVGAYNTKEEAIAARKDAETRYWLKEDPLPPSGSPPRNNRSGAVGVYFHPRDNIWIAYYGSRNTRKHIGSFANKHEAVKARNEWMQAHGIGGEE